MKLLSFCLATSLAVACTGNLDKEDDPITVPSEEALANPSIDPDSVVNSAACRQQINPGASPMRRLSNAEYQNTVSDLLGVDPGELSDELEGFLEETESLGFRNSAAFLIVSESVARQFMGAAEKFSQVAAANPNLLGCDNPGDQKACASQFVRKFGLRAYRRELTEEEATRLEGIFNQGLAYDFNTGVQWTVNAVLQSPNFLYRVEEGEPAGKKGDQRRPTSYEMASRLSYLLWQSMPDDDLFEAAKQNKLQTREQVVQQAERMIADPKANRSLEFYRQWLDTDGLSRYSRDANVFPGLVTNLGPLLRQEVDTFTKHLLMDSGGGFEELVSAPYTFVNKDLAKHYRLGGTFDGNFQQVENPNGSGVLTQAGFLTAHDKPTRTSIVRRGLKIRTDMMCEVIPAPPANVPQLEEIKGELSQRERLELHIKDPACAGCHKLMDPLGVAFEGLDAVGRNRMKDESGKPIRTDTTIEDSYDLDGPVEGARDLGQKFAKSNQARQCYVDQNFRFFYGRDYDATEDLCSRAQLAKAFKDSDYKLKDLLIALTQTDTFLYRPVNQ